MEREPGGVVLAGPGSRGELVPAPGPLCVRGWEGLGRAEAEKCEEMGRDGSSSPHALLPSAELQAPAALRWGVAARGSLCRLPADHALLSSPLPGASPVLGAGPGVLPTLALLQNTRCGQGGMGILQPAGCRPRCLPLPSSAAPVRTWRALTFFTSCWGQETRCKTSIIKKRAVL